MFAAAHGIGELSVSANGTKKPAAAVSSDTPANWVAVATLPRLSAIGVIQLYRVTAEAVLAPTSAHRASPSAAMFAAVLASAADMAGAGGAARAGAWALGGGAGR